MWMLKERQTAVRKQDKSEHHDNMNANGDSIMWPLPNRQLWGIFEYLIRRRRMLRGTCFPHSAIPLLDDVGFHQSKAGNE